MLTGQAVGAIAALAARQNKQPRDLNIIEVQRGDYLEEDDIVRYES
jgi:hypothetical protein